MVDHDSVESVAMQATPQEIASAMLAQMAKAPLQQPPALPNWDECAARLRDVYREVLAGAGAEV
jgi:hypothetical protein